MSLRLDYGQHVPDLTKKLLELTNASRKAGLEGSLLDLVNLRVSQLNGCAFCVDMHTKEMKIHGERELRIHHVVIWRESPLFTPRERAALEWAEAATELGPHGVSDLIYGKTREHFNDAELSALTFSVAIINAWNRLGVSFTPVPGSMDKAWGLDRAGLT